MTTPAKSVKSSKWFVRVDGNHDYLRQKCNEFASKIDVVSMLCALHKGGKKDNPHCHYVIELSSVLQKQSFALRVKSHFGITKKTEYAVDVWDGERGAGACSYLYHEEDADVIVTKGFTEEDQQRARDANLAVQKVIAVNKDRAATKLVDRAVEHFQDRAGMPFLRTPILTWMLKEIKMGNHYYPGEYMLKKFVEEVELHLCDDLEGLAHEMYKRMWRD